MIVREAQPFLVIVRAHDGEHRPEDLLLVDAHGGRHLVEQAGAHEEALLVALHLEAAPVHEQLGPFIDASLHEALHALQRRGGDERAEVGLLVRVGGDL